MPAAAVIELRDVDIAAGGNPIVRRLTCDVATGRVLAFVAEDDATRTALASVLSGSLGDYRVGGDLVIEGRELLSRVGEQARAFAERYVARVAPVSADRDRVQDVVRQAIGRNHHERSLTSAELLDRVGLDPEQATKRCSELTAADRVRVGFAIALAADPLVLVVELPRATDDEMQYTAFADCVRRVGTAATTSVIVCTDGLATAADVADDVVVLLDGCVVESGTVYDIAYRAAMPYVQALLAATPNAHLPLPELPVMSGVLAHSGCPWRLNCDRVIAAVCAQPLPDPVSLAPGHVASCHALVHHG